MRESPMFSIWDGDKLTGLEIRQLEATSSPPTRLEEELVRIFEEHKQLKEWLIEERLPNYCTGEDCGCAERVAAARVKMRIKLLAELEQALKENNGKHS